MSKAHPLLHSFKLAESAIEATVSACVQSYAMIFRNLSGSDYIFTFVSCVSSYASIALVFAQLDRRDGGLQGLPGLSVGWCLKWVLVLIFRACEVLSRIISICIFQLLSEMRPSLSRVSAFKGSVERQYWDLISLLCFFSLL
jgi:hypothetical protein